MEETRAMFDTVALASKLAKYEYFLLLLGTFESIWLQNFYTLRGTNLITKAWLWTQILMLLIFFLLYMYNF